jgi:hypothetical protein
VKSTKLLADLLTIAEQQRSALAADDLAEFARLAARREPIQAALPAADWNDATTAREIGLNVVALDHSNADTIRLMLAETSRARSGLSRGARALHGYGGPTQARGQTVALYDHDA